MKRMTFRHPIALAVVFAVAGCNKPEPVSTIPYNEIESGPTLRMPGRATWAQAELDCRAQKTDALRDASYRKFAKELPHSPEFLTLYAIFVADSLHEISRADKLFRQALAEPTATGYTLSNFANFKLEYNKDKKGAENLYKRALEMSPKDDSTLVLYGMYLCENGNPAKGFSSISQAKRYGYSHNQRILVRVDFCRFANGPLSDQGEALYTLRTNLVNHFRAKDWDFTPNIRLAESANHSELNWLKILADVCCDKADISILKNWTGWRDAVRRPLKDKQPHIIDQNIVGEDSD